MPNFANLTIVGHLGKDPVLETKGEYTTCRFSVATSRKRKDKDLTTWWSVTAWRKDAEYASKYLKKGDAVLVSGEPYLDEYEKDGEKRTILKIEAIRVSSLASRPPVAPVVASPAKAAVDTDDAPF